MAKGIGGGVERHWKYDFLGKRLGRILRWL